MDFLDPRKRRAHKIRLMVGYVLVAIAIAMSTIVLVYGANGYGVNTKTGAIVQNGLLFINSQPGGAEIYLNGVDQYKGTSARMVIPTGDYTLTLKKSGYRTWQRSFTLEASTIDRYIYPFLFPVTPKLATLANYATQPTLITESPDQHWLLVQDPSSNGLSFSRYDTGALTKAPTTVSLPTNLETLSSSPTPYSVVEWSTDNNNVLLKHSVDGVDEYIVFDHNKPSDSFNVNKTFHANPTKVFLHNKKVSQLYFYDQASKTLSIADVNKASIAEPMLNDVLAAKPYGNDIVSYVTDKNQAAGQVQAKIWSNGQSFPLYTFSAGTYYLIDEAQFQGHWYYLAGSDTNKRVDIFKDPLSDIQNSSIGKALPTIALNVDGANQESFSNNSRFIAIENGQSFGVYDMETKESYQYRLKAPLLAPLAWMDGHRLMGQSDGKFFVTDYDSTNQQILLATSMTNGGFFSKDYNHLLTVQLKTDGTYDLVNVDMRAGVDLPKK